MTIFAAATAGPAAARIRGYSMALWAVGVLAIGAIIGLTAFLDLFLASLKLAFACAEPCDCHQAP